jgi:hypothetical protein
MLNAGMNRKRLYTRGYKLDDETIRRFLPKTDEDILVEPNRERSWHPCILKHNPKSAHMELSVGVESQDRCVIVIVMGEGYDKEKFAVAGLTNACGKTGQPG